MFEVRKDTEFSPTPKMRAVNVMMMTLKVVRVWVIAICVLCVGAGVAAAQDQAPLRLGYINTAGDSGERSYKSIEDALEDSTQIELLDDGEILNGAASMGLDMASFRQSAQREEKRADFARLMAQEEIEGLL